MPINNPSPGAPPAQQRLSERVEQTTQDAADKAVAQVRDVRARAESTIEEQRGSIARRVRRFGGALRGTSDQLAREDALAQKLLDTASERVEHVADYIERASPNDVIDDLTTIARTRPGLFFGGAFLVGLAVGRFAKSSQHARSSQPLRENVQPREPARENVPPQRSASADEPSFKPEAPLKLGASGLDLERAGSAAASGIHYSAPTVDEPPKAQPGDASREPRVVQPGEGNKS